MKRLLTAAFLWLATLGAAFAQAVVPVQMRDANLTVTASQNFITTQNTFSAPRTLVLPGRGAANSFYLQFIDTANAVSATNTLTISMADGGLINGSASLVLSLPGQYLMLVSSGTGYSATVMGSPTYAVGTWVPTLLASTPGTPTYNTTNSVGTYEIIGRQVTLRGRVQLTNWIGSPSGPIQIGGFPVPATSATQNFGACFITQYTGTTPAPSFGVTGIMNPGDALATLLTATATGSVNIDASTIGTTTPQFIFYCNYRI